jgi:cytochrome c oxidase assembly protein subunit 15|tara:strand:- start:6692 stop:7759 length:1068 start_codon:yes stop_codon:yes gene_type:complete
MNKLKENEIYNRQIYTWLFLCAGLIFCMILLGGVTRLTHSGLSMVEWKPLMGIIPPLNNKEWQASFDLYKLYPEYQKINMGMSISEYKYIFMYEYLHRILGRVIGIAFLIPFLFFYFTGRIKRKLIPKLLIMFFLGGFQGLLGWYMVKSGLVNIPSVSQYRLTAHLGNAVIIYAYILWVAFGLIGNSKYSLMKPISNITKGIRVGSYSITGLLFIMILSGGLVAGTRAGLAYSTFPLMGESFIPVGLYSLSPIWLSAFEDITTIQFNHRMFAYFLFVLILSFSVNAIRKFDSSIVRTAFTCMLILLTLQVCLGIATILLYVPVSIAAAHQSGAIALLTVSIFLSRFFYDHSRSYQ